MSNELVNADSGLVQVDDAVPLDEFEPVGFDLTMEYWSAEEAGEQRRMYFLGLSVETFPSGDDPDVQVDLLCVMFLHVVNGTKRLVANGSKRLVGVFESGKVKQGDPVQVTYRGKVTNKTNQKQGDDWSVVELQLKKGGAS